MYILLCNHFEVIVCIYCYVITLKLWYVYVMQLRSGDDPRLQNTLKNASY